MNMADRWLTLPQLSLLSCLSLFTRADQEHTVFQAACGTQSKNTKSNGGSADSTFPSCGNVINKEGFAAQRTSDLFGNNKTEKFPARHKDALSLPE